MFKNRIRRTLIATFCLVGGLSWMFVASHAQQRPDQTVAIDADDIGGIVTGPNGPEAGVWVVAETHDLPVRYIESVVTDDRGRYVVPDLPKAKYSVWVRGYGLIDSPKVTSEPGKQLNLTATPAPDAAAAAHYYPAIYWFSMLRIPAADQFGKNRAIAPGMTQEEWLNQIKSNGCVGCHQLGQQSTRTIPEVFRSSDWADSWRQRVQAGQAGPLMVDQLSGMGNLTYTNFGEWTERIAKGELPHSKPARPQGIERNVVITIRDWMDDKHYLHDLISTDKRYPTVNAYGPLYGSPEYSSDIIPILDPVKNTATTFHAPVKDPNMPLSLGPGHAAALKPLGPSAYWGMDALWDTRINNHNSMLDRKGRVWLAATIRPPANPDVCKQGSDHPSAKLFPLERAVRHLAVFDPKTQKYTFVDTCYGTHHPQFGFDANDTLWTSGGGPVLGWLNTKMFDATGDAAKSQGWTALILDTNGNGKRDEYVEPKAPLDPTKDKRIEAGFYAIMPHPTDGSIWGAYRANPGAVCSPY
jgi:hypothetical protein